jgi:hypothetical protein
MDESGSAQQTEHSAAELIVKEKNNEPDTKITDRFYPDRAHGMRHHASRPQRHGDAASR